MQIKVKCRLKIYSISFIIIFFQLLCSIYANAQTEINTKLFSEISNTQRGEFISQYPFASLDSSLFLKTWDNLFAIANKKKDKESILSLMIIKFHHRAKFKSSILEEEKLLLKIKAQAQENNNETVQLYTEHYLNFNAYLSGKISPEKMYGVVQKDYENICNHGLKNFKKYNIAKLLFHNGEFMYKLEDFDKALEYLKKAEQFPSDDVRNYILILNHIQSIYQQKKEYDNGIIYAKKIIDFIQKDSLVFYNLQELKNSWLGIATIDIANMLALQNKFDESEIYLEKGYGFVKTKDNYGYEAEYEALSVIVNTKLQLGKLAEAKTFLQRMDSLDILAKQNNYLFFKRIKYFNVAANYYEKVGNYELAIHFNNLAKPLKDSLDKRNDANKLQKISQRLQAEKFNEKLTLVEN